MHNLHLLAHFNIIRDLLQVACSWKIKHHVFRDGGEAIEDMLEGVWLHSIEVENIVCFVAWSCESSAQKQVRVHDKVITDHPMEDSQI
jgi:hypothetical protein